MNMHKDVVAVAFDLTNLLLDFNQLCSQHRKSHTLCYVSHMALPQPITGSPWRSGPATVSPRERLPSVDEVYFVLELSSEDGETR